ncbi:MAG: SusD/RagB family nutrient-binding outer membrane lipoprotein, partial [Bacteroidota bacterium]
PLNTYSARALQNLNILKALAEEDVNTQYLGIANVLLAYGWMMTTDTWGDLPYREAFKGLEITTPQYDSQEFIYEQIFELLDQAQTQLAAPTAGIQPANDDLIYQGDISKWLKAAHTLEARAHLHLGKRDANRYQLALEALTNGLENASDDMLLPFGINGVNEAPWFQFNSVRVGDVLFHPVMGEFFEALNDPRLELLEQEFTRDHPILTATRKFPFINMSERKFIESECLLRTGGDPAAIHNAYIEGIQANFEFYGLELTEEYLSQNAVDPGVGNIGLEEIILQKYLALWTAPEVFSDWRRTGLPVLIPNSGNEIPRRFLYAEKEFEGNQNTPELSQFDRVWWDIE